METKEFIVFKKSSADVLSFTDQQNLERILTYMAERADTVKNTYIVVNQDEPYADKVWTLIKQGENEKRGIFGGMRKGMKLKEKYSDLPCVVMAVKSHHMLVEFETGLSSLVEKSRYKFFEKVEG